MKKSSSWIVVLGIVCIGMVLRIPFTTIPTVLPQIAKGFNVPISSLGLVTALPLIMFAVFSSFAPKLSQKIGLEKLIGLALLVMIIGSAIRVINLPLFYSGTVVIGICIAILNVLLPSLVAAYFPNKIGLMTAVYTTTMGLVSAFASMLAVPITEATSWRGLIWVLTGVIALAFLAWLPNFQSQQRRVHASKKEVTSSIWKNKGAWIILIFGGLQSLLFYTGMTWLPTMANQAGISQATAGVLAGIYSLISLPLSVLIPGLVTSLSLSKRRTLMAAFGCIGVLGVALLFVQSSSFLYWLTVNLLIGISVSAIFPYMLVNFTLKTDSPAQAAELSGMAQSGGYFLAATGPALFGYAYEVFHSWSPAVACLLGATIIMTLAIIIAETFEKI